MNLKQALFQARETLAENKIDDASIEGEILLRHVLGITRAQLFASLDDDISAARFDDFMQLVARRATGEPTAYITGHREFYGLDFTVNPHVLIPRPETELLVEKAIALCHKHGYSAIADVGTGCGAIAVALAVNLPSVQIYATDVSSEALEVARQNCMKHGTADRITLLKGDLLKPLPEPVDLILANLPYVKAADIPVKGPLSFEPQLALNGGEKGLEKIRSLCSQVKKKLKDKASLLLEIGQGQAEEAVNILHGVFPQASIDIEKDLSGINRVVCLRLT